MTEVKNTNTEEIHHFLEQQWSLEDQDHYGDVEWQDIPFLFKAEDEGNIVGVAMGKMQSGVVLIDDIIVDRDQREKGIGKLLVEKIESFAKEHKGHKIWGYTGKGWKSVAFYESLGFTVIGQLPNHYHKSDFVIISKDL